MSTRFPITKKDMTLRNTPSTALFVVNKAMEHGAKKYGPFQWRDDTVSLQGHMDSIQRHLFAIAEGETTDPSSGMPHVAHIAAQALVILDAGMVGNLEDDRPLRALDKPSGDFKVTNGMTVGDMPTPTHMENKETNND